MKTRLCPLLAALMLTGCGASGASGLPETEPLEPLSAPAVVTEGRTPEEDYQLPTQVVGLRDWMGNSRWNLDPVGLLSQLPDQKVALYGVTKYSGSTALLRWGDALAEFDWSFGGPQVVEPRLQCWDADGDGQEEVVLINLLGSGTGVSIEELHIVEKNQDGTLTDHCFPETLWRDALSGQLSVVTAEDRTYAVLGRELVDLTDVLAAENIAPGAVQGLTTGSQASFSAWPHEKEPGGSLRFQGAVMLEGEDIPYYWYTADLSASVSYQDGGFTLSEIHLDSVPES